MATSAIALFGVLTSKAKGEPLPEGVAYGRDGGFTTDASEALIGGCQPRVSAGLGRSPEFLQALEGGAATVVGGPGQVVPEFPDDAPTPAIVVTCHAPGIGPSSAVTVAVRA